MIGKHCYFTTGSHCRGDFPGLGLPAMAGEVLEPMLTFSATVDDARRASTKQVISSKVNNPYIIFIVIMMQSDVMNDASTRTRRRI